LGVIDGLRKPDQSVDVLVHRRQEELLPYELQSPQTQARQFDLILEFREQEFGNDSGKQTEWRAFLRRSALTQAAGESGRSGRTAADVL
jgi:hypothetical protein